MKLSVATLFLFMLVFNARTQDTTQYHFLENIVSFLASDSLKGRGTGTEQETVAAEFIYQAFKENKRCKVKCQKFHFTQDSVNYNSQNIIAFVNNKAKKTIIFSAHYDHLGMGGELSHSKGSHEVHNGADDNASGVSLLLNLAKELSPKKDKYNYLFIAHSGHELGLHGTKYFSENMKKKYKTTYLFVNFDMVGRLNSENKLYYDCSKEVQDSLKLNSSESIKLSKSPNDRINTLDTKWFVAKNIPSITFSTGRHIDYHKTSDDIEHIDFQGVIEIEKLLFNWISTGDLY